VIVVNWNRKALLRACLESLARQVGPVFETIVVDNGSTDGSAEMAEELGARVIRNRENRGFCAANNQGFAAARGEFVALLNNDAEAEPVWLAALVRVCSRAPEIGMAASKVLVWEDPRRIDKVGHLIFPDGQNRGRGSGALDVGQFDREEEVLWPDGCAALYRKAMIDEIGGFDRRFFRLWRRRGVGIARAHRGLEMRVYAGGGGAAPSRVDAGKRFGAAAGVDRTQSGTVGGEAVSVEFAVVESAVLCGAIGGRGGAGRQRPRRHRAFSGAARQVANGASVVARRLGCAAIAASDAAERGQIRRKLSQGKCGG